MGMKESSIYETFTLPSKGLVYDTSINPQITLRSMTTLEEMKRLSQTDTPYKVMADIIEDCMKEKPKVHVYDMCLGDYEFLLHKLRVVTYGNEYKMTITCPNCGQVVDASVDLDSLTVSEYDESIMDQTHITLPVTNKLIELKFQTPRDLDTVTYKKKEMQKKTKSNVDFGILYTVISLIKKIDGQVVDPLAKEEFAKNLPMKDVNYIISKATELNKKVGVDNMVTAKCGSCGYELVTPFRLNNSFFRPDIN